MSADLKNVWLQRDHLTNLPDAPVPEGYTIRFFRPGDGPRWLELVRATELGRRWPTSTFESEYPGSDDVRARRILFAEDRHGNLVGTLGAWHGKQGPDGGGWGTLHWFVVGEAHQGRGVGKALLARALRVMSGFHDGAFVTSSTPYLAAIRMYLEVGFAPGINGKYDLDGWRDIAGFITHPAIDSALHPKPEDPAPADVVADLKAAAIPLTACTAGSGFADLRRLDRAIGKARLVSMGEATHGTREFFQLKHRLLEYLVVEHAFTAFAIEASYPDCFMLDRFVTTGEGDPLAGITNMRFWTWDTEEVLALVLWLREHNRRASRPVRFYGFDMQSPTMAVRETIENLRRFEPAGTAGIVRLLAPYADECGVECLGKLPAAAGTAAEGAIREAAARLATAPWPDARSKALGLLHAEVARQGLVLTARGYGDISRDRCMAENIRTLLGVEGPAGRLALWAHNFHVTRSGGDGMGGHLHTMFGRNHVVAGFAFGTGSFQAWEMGGRSGLRDFVAPPPPAGSLDDTLLRTEIPLLALDLQALNPASLGGRWLDTPRLTRGTGSVFSDDPDEWRGFGGKARIVDCYDLLLYVADTTAARPTPNWQRLPPVPRPPVPPRDRNYETAMQGGLPATWAVWPARRPINYGVDVADGEASLHREHAAWAWGWCPLSEEFDATPWRGRRVRLTAEGRVEGGGAWERAYLLVAVHAEKAEWILADQPLAFGFTADQPWIGDQWEQRALEIDVPDTAGSLCLAFAFAGNGVGRVRNIRLEAVPPTGRLTP